MKKLKSIGFAVIYLLIPILLQFIVGIELQIQIILMQWRGKEIVNISREFLDTNGAHQTTCVSVEIPSKADIHDKSDSDRGDGILVLFYPEAAGCISGGLPENTFSEDGRLPGSAGFFCPVCVQHCDGCHGFCISGRF